MGRVPCIPFYWARGIPIVEHLTNLSALPIDGFIFSAAPPKIVGMGTFPVRAHAILKAAGDRRIP